MSEESSSLPLRGTIRTPSHRSHYGSLNPDEENLYNESSSLLNHTDSSISNSSTSNTSSTSYLKLICLFLKKFLIFLLQKILDLLILLILVLTILYYYYKNNLEPKFNANYLNLSKRLEEQNTFFLSSLLNLQSQIDSLKFDADEQKNLISRLNSTSTTTLLNEFQEYKSNISSSFLSYKSDLSSSLELYHTNLTTSLSKYNESITNNLSSTYSSINNLIENNENMMINIKEKIKENIFTLNQTIENNLKLLSNMIEVIEKNLEHDLKLIKNIIFSYLLLTQQQLTTESNFLKFQFTGTLTLLTLLIFIIHLSLHIKNYEKMLIQRRIMVILWMTPIYSCTSWLNLIMSSSTSSFSNASYPSSNEDISTIYPSFSPTISPYYIDTSLNETTTFQSSTKSFEFNFNFNKLCNLIRECFEAYVVYNFVGMMIAMLIEHVNKKKLKQKELKKKSEKKKNNKIGNDNERILDINNEFTSTHISTQPSISTSSSLPPLPPRPSSINLTNPYNSYQNTSYISPQGSPILTSTSSSSSSLSSFQYLQLQYQEISIFLTKKVLKEQKFHEKYLKKLDKIRNKLEKHKQESRSYFLHFFNKKYYEKEKRFKEIREKLQKQIKTMKENEPKKHYDQFRAPFPSFLRFQTIPSLIFHDKDGKETIIPISVSISSTPSSPSISTSTTPSIPSSISSSSSSNAVVASRAPWSSFFSFFSFSNSQQNDYQPINDENNVEDLELNNSNEDIIEDKNNYNEIENPLALYSSPIFQKNYTQVWCWLLQSQFLAMQFVILKPFCAILPTLLALLDLLFSFLLPYLIIIFHFFRSIFFTLYERIKYGDGFFSKFFFYCFSSISSSTSSPLDYFFSILKQIHSYISSHVSLELVLFLIENISVMLSFIGLLSLFYGSNYLLRKQRLLPKLLMLKGVVFFTFWQYVILWALSGGLGNLLPNFSWISFGDSSNSISTFSTSLSLPLLHSNHFPHLSHVTSQNNVKDEEFTYQELIDNIADAFTSPSSSYVFFLPPSPSYLSSFSYNENYITNDISSSFIKSFDNSSLCFNSSSSRFISSLSDYSLKIIDDHCKHFYTKLSLLPGVKNKIKNKIINKKMMDSMKQNRKLLNDTESDYNFYSMTPSPFPTLEPISDQEIDVDKTLEEFIKNMKKTQNLTEEDFFASFFNKDKDKKDEDNSWRLLDPDFAMQLHYLLLCIEMLFACIIHIFVFPSDEYSTKKIKQKLVDKKRRRKYRRKNKKITNSDSNSNSSSDSSSFDSSFFSSSSSSSSSSSPSESSKNSSDFSSFNSEDEGYISGLISDIQSIMSEEREKIYNNKEDNIEKNVHNKKTENDKKRKILKKIKSKRNSNSSISSIGSPSKKFHTKQVSSSLKKKKHFLNFLRESMALDDFVSDMKMMVTSWDEPIKKFDEKEIEEKEGLIKDKEIMNEENNGDKDKNEESKSEENKGEENDDLVNKT